MKTNNIFQSISQGILICDKHSRIMYFNDAYGEFTGLSLDEVRGHKISELRPSALLPKVISTGKAIEGAIRHENNQDYFVSIYPIEEMDEIRGAISIVTSIATHSLRHSNKKETLEERVKRFERQEIEAELALYGSDLEGKRKTAAKLGISLATLYNKIKE